MIDKSLFFINQTLVERQVELADGKEHTLHFKEVGSIEFAAISFKLASQEITVRVQGMADLIVASLCNPDGSPVFTLDEIPMFKQRVLTSLFNAAASVQKGDVEGKA